MRGNSHSESWSSLTLHRLHGLFSHFLYAFISQTETQTELTGIDAQRRPRHNTHGHRYGKKTQIQARFAVGMPNSQVVCCITFRDGRSHDSLCWHQEQYSDTARVDVDAVELQEADDCLALRFRASPAILRSNPSIC